MKHFSKIEHEDKKIYPPKKHFEPKFGVERFPTPNYIKTFEIANKQSDSVYTIEKVIVAKRRVQSVRQMRNNLDFVNPGDKPYRNPECTEGFFKEGGLVPGSTNKINYLKTVGKKASNFYETIDLNVKTLDPNKLWANKVKNEDLAFQQDYVKNLKAWDKNLKKEAPPKPQVNKNTPNVKTNRKPVGNKK